VKSKLSKLALLAVIGLALTLTISCSGDKGNDPSGGNIEYGYIEDDDGQVYKTVKIGDQTWMAENLNYAGEEGDMGHCYNNSEANCFKYGRLYDWATAMAQSSFCNSNMCVIGKWDNGMCPKGWHIPKDDDWTKLMDYVGGSETAGKYLKSTSGWNSYNGKSGNGNDKYGFAALPILSGSIGERGCWWSAELNASKAYYMLMFYEGANVSRIDSDKSNFCSVRCIKY
jgi:uncharacterized protein (TIGR02145 family)